VVHQREEPVAHRRPAQPPGSPTRPDGTATTQPDAAHPEPAHPKAAPPWPPLLSATGSTVRNWLAKRWAARVVYAILLAEVGVLIWYAVSFKAVDFVVYMWGGHAVGHDTSLYLDNAGGHWFTYTPLAAALFAPISMLPNAVGQVLWELVSVAGLAAAGWATLKLAGWRPSAAMIAAVTAVALVLEPVYHTLFNGQINLILMAIVLVDVCRVAQGRRGGIGVGFAAAIKLTPGIFIVLFLLTRRTRAALIAVGTFVVGGLIGYLAAPGASRLYWTRFFYNTKRVDAPYIGNQSIYGAALRIFGGATHVGGWYLPLTVAIAAIGLGTAAVLARRGDWLSAGAVTGITGLLISPVSWTHHWVWVVPALIVLAREGVRGRIAAACGFLLFAVAPLWWTPHSLTRPTDGFHGLITLVANCYLVAGSVFLAYMAWRACRALNLRRPRLSLAGASSGDSRAGESAPARISR
jgi:Glycosyltransferase family 87